MFDDYRKFIDESYKEHILLSIAESIPDTPDDADVLLAHHHFTKELGFTDEYVIPRIVYDKYHKPAHKRIRYFDAPENVLILKEIAENKNVSAGAIVREAVHLYLKQAGYVPLQIEQRKKYKLIRKEIDEFNIPGALLETCKQISVSTKTTLS